MLTLIMNFSNFYKVLILLLILNSVSLYAQTNSQKEFGSKSVLIEVTNTNITVSNSLKPYGLLYELLQNSIPVDWVIKPNKIKDEPDLTIANRSFYGGVFALDASFIDSNVKSILSKWMLKGVNTFTLDADIMLPVFATLTYAPKWTLDKSFGNLIVPFFQNAEIPESAYGGSVSSNWKNPADLGECDDIFVLPHADPTWDIHQNLYNWNKNYQGAIWSGCHAVSVLENLKNADGTIQLNFLSESGLVLYGSHNNGTTPYQYLNPSDPVMQFLGIMDGGITNGSEQVYIPLSGTNWRNSTKIGIIDQKNYGAALVYGRAYGLATNGLVLYQGGHDLAGTTAAFINAQKAFFNFSLLSIIDKQKYFKPEIIGADGMIAGETYDLKLQLPSNLNPNNYQIKWSSNAGSITTIGNGQSIKFTPNGTQELVNITVTLVDLCNRYFFAIKEAVIIPLPEALSIQFGPIDYLAAATLLDSLNGIAINSKLAYFTILNLPAVNEGVLFLNNIPVTANQQISMEDAEKLYFKPAGFIKFGSVTFTYTVTNTAGLSDLTPAIYTIYIQNLNNKAPVALPDFYEVYNNSTLTQNVGINDFDPDGDRLTFSLMVGPLNGTATLTNAGVLFYQPNSLFVGEEVLTYKICDEAGLCSTTTVTIKVLKTPFPPQALDDLESIFINRTLNSTVALNDSDFYKEPLSFNLVDDSNLKGTLTFNANGTYQYVPKINFIGQEIFIYKACNQDNLCDSATVTITINPAPTVTLNPLAVYTKEGETISLNIILSVPYDIDLAINISASGTAIVNTDYDASFTNLTYFILKGKTQATQPIIVKTLFDDVFDPDKILDVFISKIDDQNIQIMDGSIIYIEDGLTDNNFSENPYIKVDPLLSPNNDGLGNEYWHIENIDLFVDNEVKIFNRWGNLVFKTKNYGPANSTFNGVLNTGITISGNKELPNGVYYYVIYTTLADQKGVLNTKLNKGYLILKR
jgi:gliding motility-associated-like protein